LRKKRAIEAKEKAQENEETTDEETFLKIETEEIEATELVIEAEKEEVTAATEEADQEALVTAAETEETEQIAEIDRIELEDGLVEEEAENVTEDIDQVALLTTDEATYETAKTEELAAEKESENAAIAAETSKIGRIRDALGLELADKQNALTRAQEIITDKQAQLAGVNTMRQST